MPAYQIVASFVFGGLLVIFLMVAFFMGGNLTGTQRRVLGILSALAAGVLAFFLTGAIELTLEGAWSDTTKMVVRATGGIAVFIFVMWWWRDDFATSKLPGNGGPTPQP